MDATFALMLIEAVLILLCIAIAKAITSITSLLRARSFRDSLTTHCHSIRGNSQGIADIAKQKDIIDLNDIYLAKYTQLMFNCCKKYQYKAPSYENAEAEHRARVSRITEAQLRRNMVAQDTAAVLELAIR